MLVNKIKEPQVGHRPLPFWSWNDQLEIEEITYQIDEMHKQGLGGFFMHARSGLRTEYLSQEWYACIDAGIQQAKANQMEAWIYDEEGWPSGFAGGRVPAMDEAYHAKYMQMLRSSSLDEAKNIVSAHPNNVLGIYIYERQKDIIETISINYEPDFTDYNQELTASEEFLIIIKKNNPYYVDTLNKEAIVAFTQTTHDEYYKRFGDEFGKTVKGFFTDEPRLSCDRFGDLAWSDCLSEQFFKMHAYDVMEVLPALFIDIKDGQKYRYDFWVTVSHMFVHGFMETLYDWCEEHNVQLTGHLMMEESIFSQMTSTAGVMPFYEYMHMPGIDWLRRPIASPVIAKQVGSVAAQLGHKTVLSESFALCGWDVSLEELKWIAEWQYVNGVNRICQHLEGYTIRGVRKRDYPPSLFIQQTWWDEYKVFNDYLGRLNVVLSEGEQLADALLLHPMRSGYVVYNGTRTDAIRRLDDRFTQVCTRLSEEHISYHLGDETILAKYGRVKEKQLWVGNVAYKTVILPLMYAIDEKTLALLSEFVGQGGSVYCVDGEIPFTNGSEEKLQDFNQKLVGVELNKLREVLQENAAVHISIEQENAQIPDIHYQLRECNDGIIVYMVNLSKEKTYNAHITLFEESIELTALDMNTGDHQEILAKNHPGYTIFEQRFYPMQSHVIMYKKKSDAPQDLLMHPSWKLKEIDNNALTLDMCQYRIDGGRLEGPISVIALQKQLMDLQRPCTIDMFFDVEIRTDIKDISDIQLVVEDMDKYTLRINAHEVKVQDQGYWKDKSFRTMSVRPFLHQGKNSIKLSTEFRQPQKVYDVLYGEGVYETEKNKITYDVELESIYLIGDFGVYSDHSYVKSERNTLTTSGPFYIDALPQEVAGLNLVEQGFLFFAGVMTLEQELDLNLDKGKRYIFDLTGQRAPMIHLYINDQLVKKSYWAPYTVDVTEYLHTGMNKVTLKIYASNRNVFGPHHHIHGECYNVGPESFTGKWSWVERNSEADATEIFDRDKNYWTDQYNFVTFGVIDERKSL